MPGLRAAMPLASESVPPAAPALAPAGRPLL